MASEKPTILIVPGAWHLPLHYEPFASQLRAAGFATQTISLPSVGAPAPLQSWDADVALIHQTLVALADAGKDIIPIAHSYGSFPLNEAVRGVSRAERAARGLKGGVTRLVYMAAFMVDAGVALLDATQGVPGWARDVDDGYVTVPDPVSCFYHDCDPDAAAAAAAAVKTQSLVTWKTKQTHPAWKTVPTTYIQTELDRAIPIEAQKMMCSQPVDYPQGVHVVLLHAAHSPFMNKPDEVIDIIKGLA